MSFIKNLISDLFLFSVYSRFPDDARRAMNAGVSPLKARFASASAVQSYSPMKGSAELPVERGIEAIQRRGLPENLNSSDRDGVLL
jgi:hypothetical protein